MLLARVSLFTLRISFYVTDPVRPHLDAVKTEQKEAHLMQNSLDVRNDYIVDLEMRLIAIFWSLLILFLSTSLGTVIKNPVHNQNGHSGEIDTTNVGVAPVRKCPPPQQQDGQGNCRSPWGR